MSNKPTKSLWGVVLVMQKMERQRKVSAHAEVSRNFLQMHYAPFHRAWFIKFSAKTELRQIRMSRERERERDEEREGEWEKGGKRKREREGGEGEGNVYILCSFCHNVSRKGGGEFRGAKFRYGNSKNTHKNNRIGKRT